MELENTTAVYDTIAARCKKLGISVSELCRQSDVSRQVLNNWSVQTPKSIQTLDRLNAKLEELEQDKSNQKTEKS